MPRTMKEIDKFVEGLPATVKSNTVLLLNDAFIAGFKGDVEEFNSTGKRFAVLTLRIGLRLEFAKQQLPHGQLQKWVDEHVGISKMHALRCRKLAQVFIEAQQIKEGEAFALVDPANSQKELAKKLEQMAFDFIADRTQAELFADYGIQVREPKQIGGYRGGPTGKPAELPPGETQDHLIAASVWADLGNGIVNWGLQKESWAFLREVERQNLYDIVHDLDKRLKASLIKG